jgi:excisionase family DNA binding protein
MTLRQAAERLQMGNSTVAKGVRHNQTLACEAGRKWHFDAAELDEWLKSGELTLMTKHEPGQATLEKRRRERDKRQSKRAG